MRIGRTLPPAAAPIHFGNIFNGLRGITNGQGDINRFESELKDYFKVDYSYLLSSGKAALTVILRALHQLNPERNEVIIPAFTCYSVPSAILKAGLQIRLCDINPETLDFDFGQLKKILSQGRNIIAVVPTHLLGLPMDVDKVIEIIGDDAISIIEDAAQAMGGTKKGKKIGTLGNTSFFSLGRGKAFSTVEGGIILTRNHQLAEKISDQIKSLPSYGLKETVKIMIFSLILVVFMRPLFFWIPKSLPFLRLGETFFEPDFSIKRMSPFQAGLSYSWENRLEKMKKVRLERLKFLDKKIQTDDATQKLSAIHCEDAFLLRYPLKIINLQRRNKILLKSARRGWGIMRIYPDSINHIKQLQYVLKNETCPEASKIAKQLITLPMHPFTSFSDIQKITTALNQEIEN